MASCMPIQLAAQLGAKSTFIFLLHKQTDTLWKWGPGVRSPNLNPNPNPVEVGARCSASLRTSNP